MPMSPNRQDRDLDNFDQDPVDGRANRRVDVRNTNTNPQPVIGAQFATSSNTRPTVSSTSSVVLSANANRRYAHFINNGTTTIFLKLGDTAVASQGIPLGPTEMYEITMYNLFTGAIHAIKTGASAALDVYEGTI